MPFAIRFPRSGIAARRAVWLLWLALLLPVGQLATMAHALSHAGLETTRQAEREPGLPESACGLCLVAAALDSGGLRGDPPALPHLAVRHERPQTAVGGVWLPPFARAYFGRAPPLPVPH